jgi:predicted aspartyl protease
MLMVFMSAALSACSAVADGSKPLAFTLRGHEIIVPVTISGTGPFRFLLDTGASRSVIASRVAAALELTVRARTVMITPAGHAVRPVVSVTLRLGDRPPVPVTATVANDEMLQADVDGIVGQDVLSTLVYTIDYRRRTLYWDDCAHAQSNHRLVLTVIDGRALVTLSAQTGTPEPLQFIPDTAADNVVLFARPGQQLPSLTPLDVGVLRTLAGQQLVRRVLIDALTVGGVVLRQQSAVILAGEDRPLLPGAGLLPLHLFSRVTLNGPAGYLTVSR